MWFIQDWGLGLLYSGFEPFFVPFKITDLGDFRARASALVRGDRGLFRQHLWGKSHHLAFAIVRRAPIAQKKYFWLFF